MKKYILLAALSTIWIAAKSQDEGELAKTSSEKIYIGKYKNIMKLEEGISLTIVNDGMFEISFSSGNNKMSFIKL